MQIIITGGTGLIGRTLAASLVRDGHQVTILNCRPVSVPRGKAVVEALKAAQGQQRALIRSSAFGYYGPAGNADVTEAWLAGKDFEAKVCMQWEGSTQPVEALDVRRAVMRTGLVLTQQRKTRVSLDSS